MRVTQAVVVAVLASMCPEQAHAVNMPNGQGPPGRKRPRPADSSDEQSPTSGWGFGIWNRVSSIWGGAGEPVASAREPSVRAASGTFNVDISTTVTAGGPPRPTLSQPAAKGRKTIAKGRRAQDRVTKAKGGAGKRRGRRMVAGLGNADEIAAALAGGRATRSGRSIAAGKDDGTNPRPSKRARTNGGNSKAKGGGKGKGKKAAKKSQQPPAPPQDVMDEDSDSENLGEEWEALSHEEEDGSKQKF